MMNLEYDFEEDSARETIVAAASPPHRRGNKPIQKANSRPKQNQRARKSDPPAAKKRVEHQLKAKQPAKKQKEAEAFKKASSKKNDSSVPKNHRKLSSSAPAQHKEQPKVDSLFGSTKVSAIKETVSEAQEYFLNIVDTLARIRDKKLEDSREVINELRRLIVNCEKVEMDLEMIARHGLGKYLHVAYLLLQDLPQSFNKEVSTLLPRLASLIEQCKQRLLAQVTLRITKLRSCPKPMKLEKTIEISKTACSVSSAVIDCNTSVDSIQLSERPSAKEKLHYLLYNEPIIVEAEGSLEMTDAGGESISLAIPPLIVKEEHGSMVAKLRRRVIRKIFKILTIELKFTEAHSQSFALAIEERAFRRHPAMENAANYVDLIRKSMSSIRQGATPHAVCNSLN